MWTSHQIIWCDNRNPFPSFTLQTFVSLNLCSSGWNALVHLVNSWQTLTHPARSKVKSTTSIVFLVPSSLIHCSLFSAPMALSASIHPVSFIEHIPHGGPVTGAGGTAVSRQHAAYLDSHSSREGRVIHGSYTRQQRRALNRTELGKEHNGECGGHAACTACATLYTAPLET